MRPDTVGAAWGRGLGDDDGFNVDPGTDAAAAAGRDVAGLLDGLSVEPAAGADDDDDRGFLGADGLSVEAGDGVAAGAGLLGAVEGLRVDPVAGATGCGRLGATDALSVVAPAVDGAAGSGFRGAEALSVVGGTGGVANASSTGATDTAANALVAGSDAETATAAIATSPCPTVGDAGNCFFGTSTITRLPRRTPLSSPPPPPVSLSFSISSMNNLSSAHPIPMIMKNPGISITSPANWCANPSDHSWLQ